MQEIENVASQRGWQKRHLELFPVPHRLVREDPGPRVYLDGASVSQHLLYFWRGFLTGWEFQEVGCGF